MDRSRVLRKRISILVVAGALLVAAGVAALLANTIKLRNSAEASRRSDAYLVAVVGVERQAVDAETGLRGYLITGRTLFLAPTHSAQQAMPAAVRTLDDAAAADGAHLAQARALGRAAEAYLSGYVERVVVLAGHDLRAARALSVTLTGKRDLDAIRTQSHSLQQVVAATEAARQRAASSTATGATTEAIVVLVLLTGLTLLLGSFLVRLVISRDRARALSEQTTATLRRSLLPAALPDVPDCELAARLIPAGQGEMIGGDFYDVFAVGEGRWALVVGDVCGKGAEAAAVTAMARWTVRALVADPVDPADALRALNRSMLSLDLGGRFVTMAFAVVELGPEMARVEVATAGHPAPILVPRSGEPRLLRAEGELLGVWPEVELLTCEETLAPGDGLVLYTDGVSDPGPGDRRQPTEALRGRAAGAGAEQLASRLRAFACPPGEPPRDDIAILALRFRGDQREDRQPQVISSVGNEVRAS